ncbi:MAG: hypothetical protein P9M02_00240 [Candidatus Susulua stagnicola]|nr:hypothetical protein [Candidatus Susulua stagnicola]
MEDKELLKQLASLGLPLFQTEEYFDVNKVLSDTVRSKNVRLWESFPLLLVNASKSNEFSYEEVVRMLESNFYGQLFKDLVFVSLAFYKHLHLKFRWASSLFKQLVFSNSDEGVFNSFLEHFKQNQDVVVSEKRLNLERMKNVFNNYFKKDEASVNDLRVRRDNLSLEYAMSQLFTPRQKELFLKRFRGEKMNKTEREYFSRVVKKKVLALANSELHHLANATIRDNK